MQTEVHSTFICYRFATSRVGKLICKHGNWVKSGHVHVGDQDVKHFSLTDPYYDNFNTCKFLFNTDNSQVHCERLHENSPICDSGRGTLISVPFISMTRGSVGT